MSRPSLPRVVVVNPNTNPEVCVHVRRLAMPLADGVALDVVQPSAGPFSIETVAQRQEAERQVLQLARAGGLGRVQACALACFDDIALDGLRALLGVPVVGPCEAGFAAAAALGERFTVLTTVHAAVPGIQHLLQRYGCAERAGVRAAGIGVAEAAAGGAAAWERLLDTARSAIEQDGADVLLLGSGGLAGQAPRLAAVLRRPVVDAVEAAIRAAVAAARAAPSPPARASVPLHR